MTKAIKAGVVSVIVSVTVSLADDPSYYSEPRASHEGSFREHKRENREAEPRDQASGKTFYFDRYDDGRSDYRAHVYGEDSDYFYFKDGNGSRRDSDSTARESGSRRVSGQVEEFTPMNLENRQGRREAHHIARLRLEDSGTILVDLGPKQGVSEFDLERGDRVVIRGRNGKIDNRAVLFADSISVGDREFRINRQANKSGQVTFKGEVEGYHPHWINDRWGNEHRVLKVSNTEGETWLLDLPADMSWRDLSIRMGSDFEVRGTPRALGDRQVLAATSIRVDGEEKIHW